MAASRRRFLVGLAASAACVGCASGDDDAEPGTEPGATTTTRPRLDDPTFGGFGGQVEIGPLEDVQSRIESAGGFLYVPEARAWVVAYPASSLDEARDVYDEETVAGLELGLLALYQKCPHLGCRVPECTTSQRFECPCHGSIFNHVGEKMSGPAPRGMDRFPLRIVDDTVVIHTERVLPGVAIGVQTVDAEAVGPSCIAPAN